MNSINLITMTPCCQIIIIPCRNNSFLGLPINKTFSNSSIFRLNFKQKCDFHSYPSRILGSGRRINRTQKLICVVPNSCRVFSSNCDGINPIGAVSKRGFHVIASVASDFRNYSTSVEKTRVNDKNFERIYVQGGLNNVKTPLMAKEKADLEEHEHAAATDQHEKVDQSVKEESLAVKEAWKLLENAVVTYCGSPIGTLAANDPNDKLPLNYDQVFIRDFIPSALAFLLKGEKEIVRNFLLHTLQLQSWEKTVDCYSPGQGLMPASFKVRTLPLENNKYEEVLDPDFGESAIGRVAPVDSGLWWIILLRAYGKITGDYGLQERVDVQTGVKLIINLCLSDGFDMFPSLLVTDGSCMIDRRMGIHGHPLEIQALFYSALRCSRELLSFDEGSKNLVNAINNRLSALSFHIREYYWVDMKKINEIYRYKTEEYSTEATNKFNIYPEQIPSWLMDWIPEEGGYLIGNLQPAHMDFRFFTLGNLWSIVSSLGTPKQNEAILNLVEAKWEDLVGLMPLKICYPALESEEWRIITGSDPKNTPWSYHNGGSWPTLLWQEEGELNSFSFSIAVRACASIPSCTYGKQLHAAIVKHGLDFNLPVMNSVLDMYCRCSSLNDAKQCFHEMIPKDSITWNTLIAGYEKSDPYESISTYSNMESEGLSPNCFTFSSIVAAVANLAILSCGEQIHGRIIKRGLRGNLELNNALIDMYAKSGNIVSAHRIFDKMPRKNLVSWTSMMIGYGSHGYGNEAVDFFEEMVKFRVRPDRIAFMAVLNACSHAGLVDKGIKYFISMVGDYNITPDLEIFGCVVDLLGRAGRVEEAFKLIESMPFDPDESVWGTFLGACKAHNHPDLGRLAIRKVLALKPKLPATYVVLSNIYAADGKWGDSAKMRKLMRRMATKKEAGSSSVEIKNQNYSFVAGDKMGSHMDCVDEVMKILVEHMRDTRFIPDLDFFIHDLEDGT